MAKGLQRKRHRQQWQIELAQLREFQAHVQQRQATTKPQVHRVGSHAWDWNRECRYLNHAGCVNCHRSGCVRTRAQVYTAVGSFGGRPSIDPTADAARGMILRVCLALLDLNADVVVNAGDGAEASMALRSRVAQHEDATTLLVCACARRGSLADLQREVAKMSKSGVVSVSMSPLPVSFGPGDDTATDVQHMN